MNRFTVGSLVLGAVLVNTGFALIYHPLGFITSGLTLVGIGLLSLKGKK